ncbi:MAG: hypothetical protein LAO05_05525 [Acidobacteriia bacterium]|nr:hypothetical protein [Terriglobia bacterium]
MALPRTVLLASPDDFLLELERRATVETWQAANPLGDVVSFDEAPAAARLVQELASPSLFASNRLLVVADASAYLTAARRREADDLAASLTSLPLADVTLVLSAVCPSSPTGALADAMGKRGEVRFVALPEAPKPWEEGRVSPSQRQMLATLIGAITPDLAGNDEVIDALCEVYGFRPRELAQAAKRLVLGEKVSAEAVRAQMGPGECQLRELEEALQQRDAGRFARLAGALDAGAVLTGWRGEAIAPDGYGRVLGSTLGRLLRQALAARGHATRAGLTDELDPKRCAAKDWYPRAFKRRIFPRFSKDVEELSDSPLAGMTPWQLHRAFRLASVYSEGELVATLARLGEARVERTRGPAVLAAISSVVLGLIRPHAG